MISAMMTPMISAMVSQVEAMKRSGVIPQTKAAAAERAADIAAVKALS